MCGFSVLEGVDAPTVLGVAQKQPEFGEQSAKALQIGDFVVPVRGFVGAVVDFRHSLVPDGSYALMMQRKVAE